MLSTSKIGVKLGPNTASLVVFHVLPIKPGAVQLGPPIEFFDEFRYSKIKEGQSTTAACERFWSWRYPTQVRRPNVESKEARQETRLVAR